MQGKVLRHDENILTVIYRACVLLIPMAFLEPEKLHEVRPSLFPRIFLAESKSLDVNAIFHPEILQRIDLTVRS